jgi:hypothetical protein
MDTVKVEIGQYKEINKGGLKASFSLVIYPEGQKILDCKHLTGSNGNEWFSFPHKEVKYTDGRKTEYIPLISYGNNRPYLEQLTKSVMEALSKQGSNETQNRTARAPAREVQVSQSDDRGELPF